MKKVIKNLLKAIGTTVGLMFLYYLIQLWTLFCGRTEVYYRTISFYLVNIIVFYVFYAIITKLKDK